MASKALSGIVPDEPFEFTPVVKRRRAVAEFMLNGYGPREIHNLIKIAHNCKYNTVRSDVVSIRKEWGHDASQVNKIEGRGAYLASLRQLRRKAVTGRDNEDHYIGINLELAHKLDKEIARLSGVKLKTDETVIRLDILEARDFIGDLLDIVFELVPDQKICEAIVKKLEERASQDITDPLKIPAEVLVL